MPPPLMDKGVSSSLSRRRPWLALCWPRGSKRWASVGDQVEVTCSQHIPVASQWHLSSVCECLRVSASIWYFAPDPPFPSLSYAAWAFFPFFGGSRRKKVKHQQEVGSFLIQEDQLPLFSLLLLLLHLLSSSLPRLSHHHIRYKGKEGITLVLASSSHHSLNSPSSSCLSSIASSFIVLP